MTSKRFEAWARSRDLSTDRDGGDPERYYWDETWIAWEAWQAACAAEATRVVNAAAQWIEYDGLMSDEAISRAARWLLYGETLVTKTADNIPPSAGEGG